jgi:hypothetical protein
MLNVSTADLGLAEIAAVEGLRNSFAPADMYI